MKKRGRSVKAPKKGRGKTSARRRVEVAQRPAAREPELELWKPNRGSRPRKRDASGDALVSRVRDTPAPVLHIPLKDEVPVADLFIAPSQSKMTNRELGFDQKGRCLHGCDGTRSIKKGYTNIAMHHYKCPFWETVDGKSKTPF